MSLKLAGTLAVILAVLMNLEADPDTWTRTVKGRYRMSQVLIIENISKKFNNTKIWLRKIN